MSFGQINQSMEEEDWVVTVYGVEHDAPCSTFYAIILSTSMPAQPALPPRVDDAALLPAEPQVQERPEDPREEGAAEEPVYEEFDHHGRDALAPIKPNYSLRRVLERLPKLIKDGELALARKLLVGLHERLWHTHTHL